MDELSRDFDNVFKSRGGLFIPSRDVSQYFNIKNIIQGLRTYVLPKYPSLPNINGDLILNESLNAVALKYQKSYYLGIHMGAYLLIADMFGKMFASKFIYAEIGNPDLQTEQKQTINAIIQNGIICYDVTNIEKGIGSKDPTRIHFSSLFSTFVMEFIILHEFGHIINGHTGYSESLFNNPYWDEIKNGKNKIEPHISQTLEMDADSFATNVSFSRALSVISNYKNLPAPLNTLYENIESFLINWTFAIYCFFKLCGINTFNPNNIKELDHPPASIRMSLIMNNIAVLLDRDKIKNYELILEKAVKSIYKAEEAFSMVTFVENKPEIFATNHLLATQYVSEITHNWNNVYPLVKPFAFGYIPPMVQ